MKAKVIKTGEIVEVYHESQHGQITNIYKESVLVNGRMWSEDELDFCSKPNEAPEKIYLDEDESWHLTNPNGNSVEYVRTDAFIEKSCEWLADNYSKYIITNGLATIFRPTIDFDTIRMIENFKKAMED